MTCLIRNVYSPICKYTQGWINRGLYRLYNGKGIYNSDVILVIIAKHDWNGASTHPSPVHIYRSLTNKGPHLVYRSVSSLEQINAFTFEQKMQGNRICGLWIKAHGSPSGIRLASENSHQLSYHTYININYFETDAVLLIPTFNQLEPHAAIVLESCNTGKITPQSCLAQRISELCPHHNVYACQSSLLPIGFDCKIENRTIKANYIDFRVCSHNTIYGWLKNIGCFVVMITTLGYVGKNQTIIYRSP